MEQYIYDLIRSKGGVMDLSMLANDLKTQIPDFSIKKYGFSQFKQFIKSFPHLTLEVDKKNNTNKVKIDK